ncbi:MAG: hypothetical protein ABIY37_12725 [Devosia sp.]
MAIDKTSELKRRIRDALGGDAFQGAAAGLSGPLLLAAVARLLRARHIPVTLISVAPAEGAALADFAAVWKHSAAGKLETNWFSLKGPKE